MINLSAFIGFHAGRQPDQEAIIYNDKSISYNDFYGRIQSLAAFLVANGIGEGDVVALFMKNSPAFLEIAFAASYIGAVFLPINYRLAASEAAHLLGDSSTKLLFVDEEFSFVHELHPHVVVLDESAQADSRTISIHDLGPPQPKLCRTQDLFRLMYTSGTTSRPKGVMHTYNNFYWKCIDHIIALALSAEDRLLTVGPLYHVGAFDLPGMAILWLGGTLCLHRQFEPEEVLASIERHKLTCGWMAPVMINRILAVENPDRFDVDSFRWCIGGGEKTPENRIRDFTRVFKSGRYIDGYGLTETCGGDTLMEGGREIEKIGSTGRALAHIEIQICDEMGKNLPPNTEGEICLRGPKVTSGYLNASEKTADSFFGEWFRSGDIGHLDEEGFLYITDRIKDLIVTGAENVASSEVENVIYQLPQVAEAAVIGLPDEKWGERVAAVVALRPGESLSFKELDEHCRKNLAVFKVPRKLYIRSSLPRNPSGKVLKRNLRIDYQEENLHIQV